MSFLDKFRGSEGFNVEEFMNWGKKENKKNKKNEQKHSLGENKERQRNLSNLKLVKDFAEGKEPAKAVQENIIRKDEINGTFADPDDRIEAKRKSLEEIDEE